MFRTAEEEERILNFVREAMIPVYGREFTRGGHDYTHIERGMATWWLTMNPIDPVYIAEPLLVGVSYQCHDIHRTTYLEKVLGLGERERTAWLIDMLSRAGLLEHEILIVIDAVAKHGELNSPSDSPVLVYLKDIDRLDMGAIGVLRIAAHHWIFPPYQVSDFTEKRESTEEKDLKTLIHDIDRCLEWEKFLRIARAKTIGKKRFAFMRLFRKEVKRELKELELIP